MTFCTCPTKFDSQGQLVRAYLDALCPVHAQQTGQHCPTCRCNEVKVEVRTVLTNGTRAASGIECNHAAYFVVDGRCSGCGAEVT